MHGHTPPLAHLSTRERTAARTTITTPNGGGLLDVGRNDAVTVAAYTGGGWGDTGARSPLAEHPGGHTADGLTGLVRRHIA